jgi:3-oxoacyl-(acyl-carrier-protein) synthase
LTCYFPGWAAARQLALASICGKLPRAAGEPQVRAGPEVFMERVVVTGLGVASPLGCSVEDFWSGLLAGRSGVVAIDDPEYAQLRTRIGARLAGFDERQHFDSKEVRRMSRSSLMALVAAQQAVDQSRLVRDGVDPREVAVIIGSSIGGYAASDP